MKLTKYCHSANPWHSVGYLYLSIPEYDVHSQSRVSLSLDIVLVIFPVVGCFGSSLPFLIYFGNPYQ